MKQYGHQTTGAGVGPVQRPGAPTGRWYFVVTLVSIGFLAAMPFWHAARSLGRPGLVRLALIYTALDAFLVVLMILTPPNNPDGTSGNETISTIGGLTVTLVLIAACVQLRGLRREVYGERSVVQRPVHPAVTQALAAREQRAESRRLREQDPALARELGIGRPDLGRGYADGGLVDLNTAPAAVIAQVSGIAPAHAEAIVAARDARGGTYFNLAEVFVDVALPPHEQEQLHEHAVV